MSLMEVGEHCAKCNVIDMLPLACTRCHLRFCKDHFNPTEHSCTVPAPELANHAPACPLCKKTVPFPGGIDVNEALDRHLTNDCPNVNGPDSSSSSANAKKAKSKNTCNSPRCYAKLIVPISCPQCRLDFCVHHRFPADHSCTATATATTASNKSKNNIPSRSPLNSNTLAAALRRATASSLSSPAPKPTANGTSLTSPTTDKNASNAISQLVAKSKVNRHAREELESRYQALKERAEKGTLTEQQKIHFATLQAERHKSSLLSKDKNSNCIVH